MWPDLIQKSKDGGLDVIETYVFWNLHEPVKGQVLFASFLLTFLPLSFLFHLLSAFHMLMCERKVCIADIISSLKNVYVTLNC